MSNFWNERYSQREYAYGKSPNEFFQSIIRALPAGKILLPCAGEGRDAVYAATLGWKVDAFDWSEAGKEKALALAGEQNVSIQYEVLDAENFTADSEQYDLISLTYVHLPASFRSTFYKNLLASLKPGGRISAELFSPEQLRYSSGGPKERSLLQSSEMLREEFASLEILECYDTEIVLNEGPFHQGKAAVARFAGKKII